MSEKRCAKHGLALRPDGECVLCNREGGPRAAPSEGSRTLLLKLGVFAVLVIVAAVVWRLSSDFFAESPGATERPLAAEGEPAGPSPAEPAAAAPNAEQARQARCREFAQADIARRERCEREHARCYPDCMRRRNCAVGSECERTGSSSGFHPSNGCRQSCVSSCGAVEVHPECEGGRR